MHQHECKISLTWVCNDAGLNSSMMHTKRNDTRLRLLPGAKIMLRLHLFDLVRKLTLYVNGNGNQLNFHLIQIMFCIKR